MSEKSRKNDRQSPKGCRRSSESQRLPRRGKAGEEGAEGKKSRRSVEGTRRSRRLPRKVENKSDKRMDIKRRKDASLEPDGRKSDEDLQVLLQQIEGGVPFNEHDSVTMDFQRLLESFIAATELPFPYDSSNLVTKKTPPSADPSRRPMSMQCEPNLFNIDSLFFNNGAFDSLSRNSQPLPTTQTFETVPYPLYDPWRENNEEFVTTEPPPGVRTVPPPKNSSNRAPPSDNLTRKLASAAQHTPPIPLPRKNAATTAEEKRLLDYQNSFPVLGTDVPKVPSMPPRPLTEYDRSTLSTSSSHPLKWNSLPSDIDNEGMWITEPELDYVLRQHLAQTSRAQVEISRPKTLNHEPIPFGTEKLMKFINKTIPRGCICLLIKLGGFGLCQSRYCQTAGQDNSQIRRAILARIDLALEILNSEPKPEVRSLSLFALMAGYTTSPSEGALRLIDLLQKEQGQRAVADLWFLLSVAADSGRFIVMNGMIRNAALLTSICRVSEKNATLNARLYHCLRKFPVWDSTGWEQTNLAYDLTAVAEAGWERAPDEGFSRLGPLLLKCLSEFFRNSGSQRSKASLSVASLIYAGIENGIMELARSLGATEVTDGLMKNTLLLHPALLPAVGSVLFMTIMTLIFCAPVELVGPEFRSPVELAKAPPTVESAFRLLFRLAAMAAVNVIDSKPLADPANVAATVFLRASLVAHGRDNFCAAALHEAASYTHSFSSPEEFVLWLCPKRG